MQRPYRGMATAFRGVADGDTAASPPLAAARRSVLVSRRQMRRPSPALVTALQLAAGCSFAWSRPVLAEAGGAPAAEVSPVVVEASPGAEPQPSVPLDAAPAAAAEGAPPTPPTLVEAGSIPTAPAPRIPPAQPQPPSSPAPGALAEPTDDDAQALGDDRARSSGLALGTGVGSDNVFLGGHAAYYAQFPSERVRVVAHAGGGVLYDDSGSFVGGARGGLFLAYGLRHRLVLGVYGGTLDAQSYALHGVVIGQRRENGVGFSAGWEWMHETGLYVRATVGPAVAFVPDTGLLQRSHRLLWQGNFFAVGYKLW
jgi:hypothetical protein